MEPRTAFRLAVVACCIVAPSALLVGLVHLLDRVRDDDLVNYRD